jgi:hypothetical protein
MTYITSAGVTGNNKKPSRSKKYSDPVSLAAAARAIYSGEDRLGHVAPRDGEILAYTRLGRLVGSFDNVIDAVRNLGGAARVRR